MANKFSFLCAIQTLEPEGKGLNCLFYQWADASSVVATQQNMKCTEPNHMTDVTLNRISSVNLVSAYSCPADCSCFANVVDCTGRGWCFIFSHRAVFINTCFLFMLFPSFKTPGLTAKPPIVAVVVKQVCAVLLSNSYLKYLSH